VQRASFVRLLTRQACHVRFPTGSAVLAVSIAILLHSSCSNRSLRSTIDDHITVNIRSYGSLHVSGTHALCIRCSSLLQTHGYFCEAWDFTSLWGKCSHYASHRSTTCGCNAHCVLKSLVNLKILLSSSRSTHLRQHQHHVVLWMSPLAALQYPWHWSISDCYSL
jgi:hypothetical protein